MKKLLIILPFLAHTVFAQTDSLTHAVDTVQSGIDHKIDSIESSFNKQADSLKQSYAKTKTKIESLKSNYQHKIDSLSNFKLSPERYASKIDTLNSIKLPTEKYTAKIDSLNNQLEQVQRKATAKIDSLKSKVTSKVKSLNLPPEAEKRISKLTASVDKLSLPAIDADIGNKIGIGNLNATIPGLPAGGINANVPAANLPATDASLPSVNVPGNDVQDKLGDVGSVQDKLGGITGKAEGIQQQIQEGVSAEKLEQTIESKASELDQVKAIKDQAMPEVMPGGVPTNGDEAKEQLKELAKKEAINHFAGKEAALQQAMDKMGKYKEKYNSVSSIKDLPAKRPNPLKERPFIERIVPGITLQFQSHQHFMLDVNASAGYRFTEHITGGIGWNQRWAYSIDDGEFSPSARIYGVRSYGEYKFKKGFGLRADIECMNTEVSAGIPPNEITHREWVWSAFTGVKQEYRISGILKGNIQIMYNLFDPHHKSPYVDRLNIRMGFEFGIKKKKRQASAK